MQQPTLPAEKFQRLLDYLDTLGIDRGVVLAGAGLADVYIDQQPSSMQLPAAHYSRLYKCAVTAMQTLNPRVPWAAGLGTDAFELLCRAIIGSGTLGEALDSAEKYSQVLEPITGHRIMVVDNGTLAELHFDWQAGAESTLFAPVGWQRQQGSDGVTLASGLVVWHGVLSWLIGHALQLSAVRVAAAEVSAGYTRAMADALAIRPDFNAQTSCLQFARSALDFRVVQTQDSLQSFLDNTVLQLIQIEQQPATVSEAVKRLLGTDFRAGICTFAEVAERLYMSESSLRRRLLDEQTSFQTLKDELRCQLAKERLADPTQKIADVAEQLGFTEQSSFGRSFRQWTGYTPKGWREQLKSGSEHDANERTCTKS